MCTRVCIVCVYLRIYLYLSSSLSLSLNLSIHLSFYLLFICASTDIRAFDNTFRERTHAPRAQHFTASLKHLSLHALA